MYDELTGVHPDTAKNHAEKAFDPQSLVSCFRSAEQYRFKSRIAEKNKVINAFMPIFTKIVSIPLPTAAVESAEPSTPARLDSIG